MSENLEHALPKTRRFESFSLAGNDLNLRTDKGHQSTTSLSNAKKTTGMRPGFDLAFLNRGNAWR